MAPGPARRVRLAAAVAVVLLGPAVAGCGSVADDGSLDRITERDSAGVRIVEIGADSEALPVWATVPDEPGRSLGRLDGPPEYTFTDVDDVRSMPGGGLLVADAGIETVRIYDAGWTHRVSVGGEGDGPGELRTLTSVMWADRDSVVLFDGRSARITFFDAAGDLLRTRSLERDVIGYPDEAHLLPGGRLLLLDQGGGVQSEIADDFTVRRPQRFALRLAPDGTAEDTVVAFAGDESANHRSTMPASGGLVRMAIMIVPLPFPRGGELVVAPSGELVGGPNDRFEIRWWNPEGRPTQIVRWPAADRPLTDDRVESRKREMRARYEGSIDDAETRRSFLDRLDLVFEKVELPEVVPAFSELHLDDAGRLWVSAYLPSPGDGELTEWRVFSPEGRPLGTVETPPGLQILEIGRDRLLGVWKDELDVPYVREHRIVREGGR